jgi:predicted NBD/HSP70 family sugar kinase
VLRRLNLVATLRALRTAAEPSLSELANTVGLSRPTIEQVVADLLARGLVDEVAPPAGKRRGRPARHFRFRAEAGYALGIEIEGNRTLLFVADLDGTVAGGHRADISIDASPRERLAAVRAAAKVCLAEAGLDRSQLWAVAVGTPGVIDPGGRVAFCTVVPGWQGVDLARRLGRSFPCPVLVENDANLAAVAEHWRGVARGVDDVVYVLAGLHAGVGAIIGGRLHRGRWGAAGEVGVLPELGLRDTTAALAGHGHPAGIAERRAAEVLAAAQAGDRVARARVAALATRMARGVAAMALALDPETIVVGGALTLGGGVLVDALRGQVQPLGLSAARVEASTLGDEAVALGAVRAALDRIEQELYRID